MKNTLSRPRDQFKELPKRKQIIPYLQIGALTVMDTLRGIEEFDRRLNRRVAKKLIKVGIRYSDLDLRRLGLNPKPQERAAV